MPASLTLLRAVGSTDYQIPALDMNQFKWHKMYHSILSQSQDWSLMTEQLFLVVLLCVLCFLCFYRSLCTFSVFFMSNVCIIWLLYMGLVAWNKTMEWNAMELHCIPPKPFPDLFTTKFYMIIFAWFHFGGGCFNTQNTPVNTALGCDFRSHKKRWNCMPLPFCLHKITYLNHHGLNESFSRCCQTSTP